MWIGILVAFIWWLIGLLTFIRSTFSGSLVEMNLKTYILLFPFIISNKFFNWIVSLLGINLISSNIEDWLTFFGGTIIFIIIGILINLIIQKVRKI